MPQRLTPPHDPLTVTHDGKRIEAERGEPLVLPLLVASGHALTRSPKLHRPRGPYCLRGACEGCLVRVDGVPNVMACQHPVRGGERVETQNVLGSREVDLLGATDYLFPRGIDHHRLLAGVRGVSTLVQAFARQISGLGRLGDQGLGERQGTTRDVAVLIVGGGATGLSAAAVLGDGALLCDDQLTLGGALAALDPEAAERAIVRARSSGAELLPRTTVAGLYRQPEQRHLTALVVGAQGPALIRAETVLVASGTHAPAPDFENNDVPGVISARAALMALRHGVSVGRRLAVVGQGRFARRLVELSRGRVECVELPADSGLRVIGRTAVTRVLVRSGAAERRLRFDALAVDGPGAPAFELCVQAGASLRFEAERGYLPERDDSGHVAPQVFAAGSVCGARESGADGERVARGLVSAR